MGLDFRTGNYTRYVRLGKRTIKAGEAAAIWNVNGVHREIVGPKLVYLYYSQIRFLDYFAASKDQYLHVTLLDGREENIPGPFGLYKNPVFHKNIEAKDAYKLMSRNESLVVYSSVPSFAVHEEENSCKYGDISLSSTTNSKEKKSNVTSNLVMRVIKGPAVFFPTAEDKVHSFSLDYSKPVKVDILSNVHDFDFLSFEVTTIDEEKSSVAFDVKVAISDIQLFAEADADGDLRGRIMKALTIDVSNSTSNLKWSEVNSTIRSIDADSSSSWTRLKASLKGCGCELMNCTYLNFKPSAELLKSQQDKTQKLSELQYNIAAETENLHLEKKQIALNAEKDEAKLSAEKKKHQQELEKEEAILKHNSNKIEAEQELRSKQVAFEAKLIRNKETLKAELNERKNVEVISFLKEIKALDVDLTKLLVGSGSDKVGKANGSAPKNQTYSLVCKMVEEAPAFQAIWSKSSEKEEAEDSDFEVVKKQRGGV